MAEAIALRAAPMGLARDLVELGKPRVTLLVLFTTALGLWSAPGPLGIGTAIGFLASTALLVAAANALNCYVERESDGLMLRTRHRPLPAGRLAPVWALGCGLAGAALALAGLAWFANPLTVLLGAIAIFTYVLVYTPMKRISPWALYVGAVPGAIPPLLGWAAATGSLDARGWMLFGLLFLWQIPHFIAIAIYLEEDYARGGHRVLPLVHGTSTAWRHLVAGTVAVCAISLAAVPLEMAGPLYGVAATVLGGGFLAYGVLGLLRRAGGAWARKTFLYSVAYLAVLVTFLLIDAR